MQQTNPHTKLSRNRSEIWFQKKNYSYQTQSAADLTSGWSLIGVLTPALSDEIREIGRAFNRLRKHWATPVQDRRNDVAVAFLLVKWLLPSKYLF